MDHKGYLEVHDALAAKLKEPDGSFIDFTLYPAEDVFKIPGRRIRYIDIASVALPHAVSEVLHIEGLMENHTNSHTARSPQLRHMDSLFRSIEFIHLFEDITER